MASKIRPDDKEPLIKIGRMLNAVDKINVNIRLLASQKYAPRGATLQLMNEGIQTEPAKIVGDKIVGIVGAYIENAKGYNYAIVQHEAKLRHVTRQPISSSYSDFGNGNTDLSRYRSGYNKKKKTSPKYKAEYLTKAGEEVMNSKAADIISEVFR